ncbi:aminotransferase class I/II-fold pyridoxal phosphate-dependent enzyme [Streptomyces sp. NPDC001544]|uniref:aminotransferase class I/II-fold pyridoxal phosphate-dependent enzyme n=1 Tax=Streptomyces sp. NPDC001544 TaxID=3364584 RepID=UPI0036CBEEB0
MEATALTSLHQALNVTDGHPRMPRTASQTEIVGRIPEFFAEVERRPFNDVEDEAHGVFLASIGQRLAPVGSGRIVSCYSSTISMDIVARALSVSHRQATILHPTFDNIADLFRARGFDLAPVSQAQLVERRLSAVEESSVLVLTTPNNPTGEVLAPQVLRDIAHHCEENDVTLVLDASFRGQDPRAQYDHYAILESTGAKWILIEDTGKLWPFHELKAGFTAWSLNVTAPIRRAFDEILLSCSPVVLRIVTELARDGSEGGYCAFRGEINRNRSALAAEIDGSAYSLTDPESRISVARVTLPAQSKKAREMYLELVRHGVHALPCEPFYWNSPDAGSRYLRFSLARPEKTVLDSVRTLLGLGRAGLRPRGSESP